MNKFMPEKTIVGNGSEKQDSIVCREWLSHLNNENINSYLKHMIESRIKILRGYPSSILFLAQYVIRTKCEIPELKMILTASEVLTDEHRFTIEKAFKVKVFNHYGLAEQIVMMGDCEKHEGNFVQLTALGCCLSVIGSVSVIAVESDRDKALAPFKDRFAVRKL
jgi:phenylacetate-coenzyme A ligase PaaK-like adenylate-forming protein